MTPRALLLTAILLALPLAGCADTATPSGPTEGREQAEGAPTEDDFEDATLGGVPSGWTVAAGNWSIVANETSNAGAKVLLSDQTDLGETSILNDAAGEWSDLDARVKINVLAGEKGQAGGIIFRYEDAKNYYVVRYNHNELSWNLFRTIDGDRQKFGATEDAAEFV